MYVMYIYTYIYISTADLRLVGSRELAYIGQYPWAVSQNYGGMDLVVKKPPEASKKHISMDWFKGKSTFSVKYGAFR